MGYKNDKSEHVTNKTKSQKEEKIEAKENWRNEHGHPSFEYLRKLAEDGGSGALEKLRSIAQDLDVEYSPGASAEDLIGEIRLATQNDPNTTS